MRIIVENCSNVGNAIINLRFGKGLYKPLVIFRMVYCWTDHITHIYTYIHMYVMLCFVMLCYVVVWYGMVWYVYVYVFVCMCVCVYVFMCVCMYVCLFVWCSLFVCLSFCLFV
jgi:nuclear pore complex protein Nup62